MRDGRHHQRFPSKAKLPCQYQNLDFFNSDVEFSSSTPKLSRLVSSPATTSHLSRLPSPPFNLQRKTGISDFTADPVLSSGRTHFAIDQLSLTILTALADSSKSRALPTRAISLPAPESNPINFLYPTHIWSRTQKSIPFLFQRPKSTTHRSKTNRNPLDPSTHLYTHSFLHNHVLDVPPAPRDQPRSLGTFL